MGPPPPMPVSANAPVLFKKHVAADASVRILTVQPPIPVPPSEITTAGIPQITVTPSEDARSSARQAYAPAKKKIVRPVRPAEPLNRYAFDPFSRQSGTIQ